MKKIGFIALLCSLLISGCAPETTEIRFSDPAAYNMKFIPENPKQTDNIELIVFGDCTYNTLSGVSRTDKTIEIRKQFNSMMKLPCFPQNDTIEIGQLPEGTYTVKYKLVDLSTSVKDSIALSLAFSLGISR